jgi:hypothetical protein
MVAKVKFKSIFLIACLPLLAWFYHNQVANWHYHETENGDYVAHAHPFDHSKSSSGEDNPAQNHSHSDIEMIILGDLNQSENTTPSLTVINFVLYANPSDWSAVTPDILYKYHFSRYYQPRSPPALIV